MIRWEDKSRHTPRGRLADAPAPRTIEQAKADREICLNPGASAAGWIVAFCPHCRNKRAKTNPTT